MNYLFLGQIIHTKSINEIEIFTNGYIVVENGKITEIGDKSAYKNDKTNLTEVKLEKSQFLLPGFIDCHIHAAQMPNIGLGLDMGLLDWLNTYTFPLEAEYKDAAFARHVYKNTVKQTLSFGTTTACYFATNHKNGSITLAEEAKAQGQRAFVGKVSSNQMCPDYYVESTKISIEDNLEFIKNVLNLKSDLVQPIVTPRFAISCDMELLKELGRIAKEYNLHIQTHISESLGEIDLIKTLFPDCNNYADVYDKSNLLTRKTILAHSVHLEDAEMEILKKRGTSIAHCPASNTNLSSGLCDVKRLLKAGIKVGLGTDVAGGNKASLGDAMRSALDVSHHLEFAKKQDIKGTGQIKSFDTNYIPFTYKEILYLATLGGAEALAIDDKIGNFTVGKEFDALLIDTASNSPIIQYNIPENITSKKSEEAKLLELLQKFIYVGDDRNISKVFVNGVSVKNF